MPYPSCVEVIVFGFVTYPSCVEVVVFESGVVYSKYRVVILRWRSLGGRSSVDIQWKSVCVKAGS